MPDSPQTPALTRSNILVGMAITAVVLFVVAQLWLYVGNFAMVPTTWQWQHLLIGLGVGGLITLLSKLVYMAWPGYREAANVYLEMVLKPLELPDMIWLGLLPGFSEEILFRGVALPGLGMSILAVIVSSIVFGALHMISLKQWQYTVWAMTIGLILGFTTYFTGNLLPAIVAHVLTNSSSGVIWKLSQPKQTDRQT
ncbi:Abortive infection protein [Thalassoporum mexicanum PCC 7367]|uniref:CPBP family intramembrane glutamic endopeptidase n=1 Tax=Thalassoporum mexicanum TaxID=3457544 RepID=UPI00029F99B8|nr:CPBP family intramembrane glutamic endopeptidase [Pseudanabaena sp. PCC 7367]AFY70852.1 Abortive infection protein [Pseudanabaena sp. PCC 7367]